MRLGRKIPLHGAVSDIGSAVSRTCPERVDVLIAFLPDRMHGRQRETPRKGY